MTLGKKFEKTKLSNSEFRRVLPHKQFQKTGIRRMINLDTLEKELRLKNMMKKEIFSKYRGVWLIIDEFNRADIDKAFGGLFTALEYRKKVGIKIPTDDPERIL